MKLLITGSLGLVGTNIIPLLAHDFDVVPLDIMEWDITDAEMGGRVIRHHRPDVVVNLAAMTDVDGCEDLPDKAQELNSDGPAIVAQLCKANKIRFVHFSTDYVFDGEKGTPYTEKDQPNPLSVYGKTKLTGEQNIFRILPSSVVLRAEWIYGCGGNNFITKVMKIANETGAARVVNDQWGTPTYAKDIAAPLARLIQKGESGIYHVANRGSCSWYEFAKEIFSRLRMDVSLTPVTSSNLDRKATRPKYSVFNCLKIEGDTGMAMRSWQEALGEYLTCQR
ncbi:MAG: dTDP-4-dehydrorhamnose reductase [Syntrophobacterales bacterium]|jgi:dTDP-4-dehydrorhamnose reductase|nr:dTDP-4-dehydrorhamnose reductase [Syntrophobacterales bacterium]